MDSGDGEQNFWPGFVDALSNVILVMIFVVLVFVVSLFYFSQKMAQSQAKVSAEKVREESSAELDELKKEISELKLQRENTSQQVQATAGSLRSNSSAVSNDIQVKKVEKNNKDIAPGLSIDSKDNAVTLNFKKELITLSEEDTKALDGSIGEWIKSAKSKQGKIIITGVIGSVEFSEERRRAYYRTVAIRNYLIDAGVSKEFVVSRVATSQNSPEKDSRVIVQYLKDVK